MIRNIEHCSCMKYEFFRIFLSRRYFHTASEKTEILFRPVILNVYITKNILVDVLISSTFQLDTD